LGNSLADFFVKSQISNSQLKPIMSAPPKRRNWKTPAPADTAGPKSSPPKPNGPGATRNARTDSVEVKIDPEFMSTAALKDLVRDRQAQMGRFETLHGLRWNAVNNRFDGYASSSVNEEHRKLIRRLDLDRLSQLLQISILRDRKKALTDECQHRPTPLAMLNALMGWAEPVVPSVYRHVVSVDQISENISMASQLGRRALSQFPLIVRYIPASHIWVSHLCSDAPDLDVPTVTCLHWDQDGQSIPCTCWRLPLSQLPVLSAQDQERERTRAVTVCHSFLNQQLDLMTSYANRRKSRTQDLLRFLRNPLEAFATSAVLEENDEKGPDGFTAFDIVNPLAVRLLELVSDTEPILCVQDQLDRTFRLPVSDTGGMPPSYLQPYRIFSRLFGSKNIQQVVDKEPAVWSLF
jgi:hypothetical protein